MASNYKLTYFDARSIAEVSRMLFAVTKTPFEDHRVALTFGVPGDFSTIQRPEFDSMKAAGELDVSLGKIPFLTVDGVKLGQSKAIERFLARKLSLMGSNDIEAAQIDSLCESIRDVNDAYGKVRALTDADAKAKAMTKWFAEDLPTWMKLIEKSLPAPAPGSPYLIGSNISLADVVFYRFLLAPKGAFDDAEGAKASYQSCSRIKAAVEAVDKNADLQAYIATRKDTFI